MKYHVHVYKVAEMAEINIFDCEDEEQARSKAIDAAKWGLAPLVKPDCEWLALSAPYVDLNAPRSGCPGCGGSNIDVDEEREDGKIVLRCLDCNRLWESK